MIEDKNKEILTLFEEVVEELLEGKKRKRTQPTTEKFPCSNERLHYNINRSKMQIGCNHG